MLALWMMNNGRKDGHLVSKQNLYIKRVMNKKEEKILCKIEGKLSGIYSILAWRPSSRSVIK